jgi:hypothetical protein
MAWYDRFNRSGTEDKAVTISPDRYPIEIEEEAPERNLLMLGALGLATLACAVLIVLGGRLAYHHWHTSGTPMTIEKLPNSPPTDLKSGQ